MPIPLPNLDDRRWADLVEESRALIPVYAPEWTDHNASDPGITLVELFAFITEGLLYRANRISDRQRRRMLALAGIRMRGPKPARVLLSFDCSSECTIPEGAICSGTNASGERVAYRTLSTVSAVPGSLSLSTETDALLALALSDEVPAGTRLSLGFIVRGDGTSFAERERIVEDGSPLTHHTVRLRWECLVQSDWEPIVDVDDHTRSLTLDGIVGLTIPADTKMLRATVVAGEFDTEPGIVSVFLNATVAEQSVFSSQTAVAVATGDGSPFQKIALSGAPVVGESVLIETDDGAWEQRDDLVASLPSSRHYTLDPERGLVTFGDGNQGQAPADGTEIRARYLQTRVQSGEVARFAIDRVEEPAIPDLAVTNPMPSEGSAEAETLDQAIGRLRVLREASLRAVTLQDIETIALETPGAEIARVSAHANRLPGMACVNALGVVTVVIVPDSDAPRPTPSAGLLSYVARRLERCRVIGTRFVVTGPDYVEVAVHASVRMQRGARRETVRTRILEALRSFFDPLTWPLGRDVYRSEVLQGIDAVEGVDRVERLELAAHRCEPRCGNVCLPPGALVAEGAHLLEVLP